MIIRMKKTANRVMVEHISAVFYKEGFDVHIKNGDGNFVVAILGRGAGQIDLSARNLPGIEKMEKDNKFFQEHYSEFAEASHFFKV